MRLHLNASEVAELADLLEDAPFRTGTIDEVLQAAEEDKGMVLKLHPSCRQASYTSGREEDMPGKVPTPHNQKKKGKSIQERRAEKRAKKAGLSGTGLGIRTVPSNSHQANQQPGRGSA